MNEAKISLRPGFLPEAARRRVERTILEQDRRAAAERRASGQRIEKARSDYRRQLADLMGRANMRRYRERRTELARMPRAKRIREARQWLADSGVDLARADRLRRKHIAALRELIEPPALAPRRRSAKLPQPRLPHDHECTPWVTYAAPYGGYYWVYAWNRSDEPRDPVLNGYHDPASGRIGSLIRTVVTEADDDDFLEADYYSSLNVWHTVQATGMLEAYLAFEFTASPYSGKMTDEWYWSEASLTQWAQVRFRVVDPSGPSDVQEHQLLYHLENSEVAMGGDLSWNDTVASPREIRAYPFRTAVPLEQGRAVLIEAGIYQGVVFRTNDYSITTSADLNLRLAHIQVRSCPEPFLLKG